MVFELSRTCKPDVEAVASTTVAAVAYSGCDTTVAAAAVTTAAAAVSVVELPAGVAAALADPADRYLLVHTDLIFADLRDLIPLQLIPSAQ